MNRSAELYLSFAAIFHRPHQDVAEHLEELIDLWREEIPESIAYAAEIGDFCRKYPAVKERLDILWEHYIPLFEAGAIEAIPYASVHFQGQVLGQEAEEVRKFYLSCGYDIGIDKVELPDHLAVELEFLALLAREQKTKELAEFEKKHLRPFLKKLLPLIYKSNRMVYSSAAKILELWQSNLDRKGD